MAAKVELAHLPGRARGVPMFGWNPLTGLQFAPRGIEADSLTDGEPVVILEHDYLHSSTTFIRSDDGGRTWRWFQVYEILATRKQ